MDKAYDMAVNGNPGPVHISIPVDLLYSSYEEGEQEGERAFASGLPACINVIMARNAAPVIRRG